MNTYDRDESGAQATVRQRNAVLGGTKSWSFERPLFMGREGMAVLTGTQILKATFAAIP
jgi:hypothetical protein